MEMYCDFAFMLLVPRNGSKTLWWMGNTNYLPCNIYLGSQGHLDSNAYRTLGTTRLIYVNLTGEIRLPRRILIKRVSSSVPIHLSGKPYLK